MLSADIESTILRMDSTLSSLLNESHNTLSSVDIYTEHRVKLNLTESQKISLSHTMENLFLLRPLRIAHMT